MTPQQLDQKLHGVLAGLTETEFADWQKKATKTIVLRNLTDAELLAKVAQLVEPEDLAQFEDAHVLQYSQEYERESNVVKLALMTARHVYNRLELRDQGTPATDDPIGRALAETGRTRRVT